MQAPSSITSLGRETSARTFTRLMGLVNRFCAMPRGRRLRDPRPRVTPRPATGRADHVRTFLLESAERRHLGRVRDELRFDRARRPMLHLIEEPDACASNHICPRQSGRRARRTSDGPSSGPRPRRDRCRSPTTRSAARRPSGWRKRSPRSNGRSAGATWRLSRVKRSAVVAVGEPVDTGVYLAEHDARGTRKETILRLTSTCGGASRP